MKLPFSRTKPAGAAKGGVRLRIAKRLAIWAAPLMIDRLVRRRGSTLRRERRGRGD